MNTSELNEDSNSVSMGFAQLEMKVSKPKKYDKKSSQNIDERIRLLEHTLITSLTIVTPIQLQNHTLRTQLRNFRFEKRSKSIGFGNQILGNQERQFQQLFTTLKDLYYNWRESLAKKIFIAFGNGDLAYFFHKPIDEDLKKGTKKGGSFILLSCKRSSLSSIARDFKIPYEELQRSPYENERILIRNAAIQPYWKSLVSLLMQKPANFEVVSNFYFMNAMQILPVEVYNGKEQRPQYDYIAEKKKNIFGEDEEELYSMKIEGFWMRENVAKMCEKLEQICEKKAFEVQFEYHPGTDEFQKQCEQF